jgi:hypothetical protein
MSKINKGTKELLLEMMGKVNNVSFNDDVDSVVADKEEVGDELQGGLGDNANISKFSKEQIKKGLEVEREHSDDPMVALDIVFDHLTEDPEYYGTNANPEKMAQCQAMVDANKVEEEPKSEDDQLTDVLLGFKSNKLGSDFPLK